MAATWYTGGHPNAALGRDTVSTLEFGVWMAFLAFFQAELRCDPLTKPAVKAAPC